MTSKTHKDRFTLEAGQWYAAEIISDEFSTEEAHRSYSPIRVDSIKPIETGNRQFSLQFYHANYPEGVRSKRYLLQTLERGKNFILARSDEHGPTRVLLIYEVTWSWLCRNFGIEQPNDGIDVSSWLTRNV